MRDADLLYPPVQYGGGWLWLALTVLVLLILAALLVLALTRPRRAPTSAPDGSAIPSILVQLRAEYQESIHQIEQGYLAGSLTARQANIQLSRVVRGFVNEYSGLEAPVLSLQDLAARGVHPALLDAIGRHYYPGVFRPGPSIDPLAGAEAARQVVQSWH